jgi:hypothetical protein
MGMVYPAINGWAIFKDAWLLFSRAIGGMGGSGAGHF